MAGRGMEAMWSSKNFNASASSAISPDFPDLPDIFDDNK
ncbi:hypothetical protein HMPREF9137_1174 [Prevotella denticola F0289]|nr:hypothetical protein HMPREF9137_1174 [Prevotella denticola F0289]